MLAGYGAPLDEPVQKNVDAKRLDIYCAKAVAPRKRDPPSLVRSRIQKIHFQELPKFDLGLNSRYSFLLLFILHCHGGTKPMIARDSVYPRRKTVVQIMVGMQTVVLIPRLVVEQAV